MTAILFVLTLLVGVTAVAGRQCYMCPNGGRDTKDCLDSKTWEVETCDAGDICQIKQKVDPKTGKILETDRDCNERRKCRPGCRKSWDGRITCKKCCDDDFCNTELDITEGHSTSQPDIFRTTRRAMTGDYSTKPRGGRKCYMCPNGGRDTKDCLDSKTWEIETCDAGDICQIKQKVDLNTGKILETDRDCNERHKCRPGCRRSWDGRVTCKKCCDDDFCNTELDITDANPTRRPFGSRGTRRPWTRDYVWTRDYRRTRDYRTRDYRTREDKNTRDYRTRPRGHSTSQPDIFRTTRRPMTGDYSTKPKGGRQCYMCPNGGKDTKDCLNSKSWEVETCDAGDICQIKQKVDKETGKVLETDRDCNERQRCRPGCRDRGDGTITCKKCCDDDFCNTELDITEANPTRRPDGSRGTRRPWTRDYVWTRDYRRTRNYRTRDYRTREDKNTRDYRTRPREHSSRRPDIFRTTRRPKTGDYSTKPRAGRQCYMCPNGGRDTKDCLDSKTWEVETCDAGDICQIKQKVDKETGKVLETDRDCNERRKCRPGCRDRGDGTMTCRKCCDDDFCNTDVLIA